MYTIFRQTIFAAGKLQVFNFNGSFRLGSGSEELAIMANLPTTKIVGAEQLARRPYVEFGRKIKKASSEGIYESLC